MVKSQKTSEMVKMALFIALIILLSVTPLGYIPLGAINATTIQMPVIIGAVLFGWKKGAVLGGVFGLTSLIKNTIQPNLTSFVFSPFVPVFGEESGSLWAIVISIVPRIMIGVVDRAKHVENTMYCDVDVNLAVDFQSLSYVTVSVFENKNELLNLQKSFGK